MNDITRLFRESDLTSDLLNALPCGVLIIEADGTVVALNDSIEQIFGVNHTEIIGAGFGKAFCCVNTCENKSECGPDDECIDCVIRDLAMMALHSNLKKRRRVSMQVNIDHHIKDVTFLVCAAPLRLGRNKLGLLTIEDITNLKSILPRPSKDGFQDLVCGDQKMKDLCQTVKQIAQTNAPVLIQGESGTGKELVATSIHKESRRAGKRFVTVNCGALPVGLLESELFGHVRGAFTGAHYDKKGRFELADGGTIFLDEVAEMNPEMQVKFLRVLQDGGFERVGDTRTRTVDVRVISATNIDLEKAVAAGKFRRDLYYRLCVMPVNIPPLRERGGDIELLAKHFLKKFSEESYHPHLELSKRVISIFNKHQWPGNCREMQNVIQYALVKCGGEKIEPKHLSTTLFNGGAESFIQPRRTSRLDEKTVIEALQKAGGNKRRAAEILGVARSTLYRFFERQRSK